VLNKPSPRHEKNRHHLATCVVALAAVPFFLLLHLFVPASRPIVLVSAAIIVAVLAVRTVTIEMGVRRSLGPREETLERRGRRLLCKTFGITFVEDSRNPSE